MEKQIGKYALLKELGRGGMGEVYLARDTESPGGDKTVALKILPPELTRSPQYVERFRREARAVARLDHPHIIKVFEIGEENNIHYIAMEYLSGLNLGQLLRKRGRLPFVEAARTILDIAEALEVAHSNGVIHRDIKPDNLHADARGEFKVMDFGIARMDEGTQLTMTGTIMGTPEYMSPEQASGKKVDHRTDIYSLGIVFYEMITGKVPFHAETALEVIQMHITQTPESPKVLNPDIPGTLAGVINKMVEKNPNDRYASFRHMANALIQAVPRGTMKSVRMRTVAIEPEGGRPAGRASRSVGERRARNRRAGDRQAREKVVMRIPAAIKVALALSIVLNIALFGLYMTGGSRTVDRQPTVKSAFTLGSEAFAPPVEADGVMYVGAQNGTLYACDLHTGRVDWTFETGGQITAAPVVDGDRVYVGSWDKNVYALDTAVGMLLWKVDVGDIVSVAPVLSEGALFVTTRDGIVFALDAKTGSTRWKDVTSAKPKLAPAIHDGILYIDGGNELLAYDTRAGRRLGGFPTGRLKTAPVPVGDRLYYVQTDDTSGKDELRFFTTEPGPTPGKIRVNRPEWNIPLAPIQDEY